MARRSLSGTPWHTTGLRMSEGEKKRHRSRCIYFNREGVYCSVRRTVCIGSAHCDYYREKQKEKDSKGGYEKSGALISDLKSKQKITPTLGIGATLHHKTFGEGKVIKIQGELIYIKFEDQIIKRFNRKECFDKKQFFAYGEKL